MCGNPWASGSLRATGSCGLHPESKGAGGVTPMMFIQSQADTMSSTICPLEKFLNQGPQKNLETDACCQWPKNYGVDSKYSSWFPVAWLQNPLFRYFSIHQMSIFITWTRVEMWKLLAIKTAAADSVWLHFIVPPAWQASQQGPEEEYIESETNESERLTSTGKVSVEALQDSISDSKQL